jgi:membrane protease YdiL (CAAX protease family)
LAFTYVGLLGSAVAVTWVTGGRHAVLRFLAQFIQWRFGVVRWLYIVLALPLLTVTVAALSGTLETPTGGWVTLMTGFLLQTFVYGALEVNIAEEGAWSGHVQSRLADRHGVLGGALRTTPLFVAMHLPLQFAAGWTWASVVVGVVALAVMAPFFRYLLGETLHATDGSLLAVGILHAAFNASGQLGFPGGWQFLPAVIVLAIAVGLIRRFHLAAVRPKRP